MSTPKRVVDAIEARLGIIGAPTQVRDAIEVELLETFKLPPLQAAEITDRIFVKVVSEINSRWTAKEQLGEVPVLHLRGTDELLCGSSYVFGDDTEQIKQAKRNRASNTKLLSAIRALSFREFEVFGHKVLTELGARIAEVTPHTGDQGIDFYGELTVGSLLGADASILRLMHDTKVILVGQAKHYPDRSIGPSTVRELVGALSLARTATFSDDNIDLLDKIDLRPFSPVLAMLFSTGDFTRGARILAKQAGLIVFSGVQLAVFLAEKGVAMNEKAGVAEFDSGLFAKWLTE